jgi:SAM-dependent methyltransferase
MSKPEQYWIDRGKDVIGMDVLRDGNNARQAPTYRAIAQEVLASCDADFEVSILDIGCNVGALEKFISWAAQNRRIEVQYVGIDSNPKAVEYCQAMGLDVSIGNLRELPVAQFDCVVVKDVLEHLEDLELARGAFAIASKTVIISFFMPPIRDFVDESIKKTEQGYYHNKYNEGKLMLLILSCGFSLVKRIDTWETGAKEMNSTYVCERVKIK